MFTTRCKMMGQIKPLAKHSPKALSCCITDKEPSHVWPLCVIGDSRNLCRMHLSDPLSKHQDRRGKATMEANRL